MGLEIEISGDQELMRLLNLLAPTNVYKAISRASKRAATAARTAGTKQLRSVYTIKSGDLKSRAAIKTVDDGSVIDIKGPVEPVKKFQAGKRKRGIFVTIKRGNGSLVPRSFDLKGEFVARKGKARYPLKGLYGPSVPQMFGNPEVLDTIKERGVEVFETRLEHEIDRLMGG